MGLIQIKEGTQAHRFYLFLRWSSVAALLVFLPWMVRMPARIDQLTQVAAMAVALLGLSLVVGYSGQVSLGHSAFVGLGAYVSVILVADHHWPYLLTIPVAFVICFLVGIVLGLPALRIDGLYMAVVTLAVAAIFPVVIVKYGSLTGGANGKIAHRKMLPPKWTTLVARNRFDSVAYRYFVVVALAAAMFAIAHNLIRGRVGRSIVALRDNPTGAAVSGVHLGVVRTMMFGISAAYGGVAGCLLIIQLPQATDGRFGLELAIFMLVALFAGGAARLSGSIWGALIYVFLPYYSIQWAKHISFLKGPGASSVSGVIYGGLLLVFVFVLPGGMAEGLSRLWARVVRVSPQPRWLTRYHQRRDASITLSGRDHGADGPRGFPDISPDDPRAGSQPGRITDAAGPTPINS